MDAEIEKLWQDKEYRAKDMREEVRFQERAAETEKQNVLKSAGALQVAERPRAATFKR